MKEKLEKVLRDKEVVVTWSGGLDTTVLLALLLEEFNLHVFPIFVNRSQSNYVGEKKSVDYFSETFYARYPQKFHMYFMVTVAIPPLEIKKSYPSEPIPKTHALRNSDIVNQAVRYALVKNIKLIAVGSLKSDIGYGDDSREYWKAKNNEVKEGTGADITILAPFQELEWAKDDLVRWASKKGIEMHRTWSCYHLYEKHCGKCGACERRKDAFKTAGVSDLTEYQ